MAKHKVEDLVIIPKSVLDDMYRHYGGSLYLYIRETKPLKPLLEEALNKGKVEFDQDKYTWESYKEEYLKKEIII